MNDFTVSNIQDFFKRSLRLAINRYFFITLVLVTLAIVSNVGVKIFQSEPIVYIPLFIASMAVEIFISAVIFYTLNRVYTKKTLRFSTAIERGITSIFAMFMLTFPLIFIFTLAYLALDLTQTMSVVYRYTIILLFAYVIVRLGVCTPIVLPIVVIENVSSIGAIQRSFFLTRGCWWKVYFWFGSMLFCLIVSVGGYIAILQFHQTHAPTSLCLGVLSLIILSAFVLSCVSILFHTSAIVLYNHLLSRKK